VSFHSPDLKSWLFEAFMLCSCWCKSQCNRWLAASCLLYFIFPEFFKKKKNFFFFWSFTVIKLGICLRNNFWFLWPWSGENDMSVFWEWILVENLCPLPRLFFFFFLNFTSQTVTLKETVGAVPQVIHKMSLCLLFHSPSGCKAKLESCLF